MPNRASSSTQTTTQTSGSAKAMYPCDRCFKKDLDCRTDLSLDKAKCTNCHVSDTQYCKFNIHMGEMYDTVQEQNYEMETMIETMREKVEEMKKMIKFLRTR